MNPTREQIEAAARKYWRGRKYEGYEDDFIAGALWMQEQMEALIEQLKAKIERLERAGEPGFDDNGFKEDGN